MTQLIGFASLLADTFAVGPQAGADISANGRTGPFPGQPVQGFSGVQFAPSVTDGSTFLFLSDNGFGAQTNSADYLLRLYEAVPNFRTAEEDSGDGTIGFELDADGFVTSFIQLSDPNNLIPFEIVNEGTEDRLLTGADFDIESFVIAENGDLFIGEEFGPFLLHFDSEGELLEAPIATPNITNLDTLNGQDPIVIGHRGASGSRPEHTLAAYELAIEQGADFIEPDLVATLDGVLIARHEPILAEAELDEDGNIVFDENGNPVIVSATTNVAELEQFADRLTVKLLDGVPFAGWFAEDFTLEEIKELRARERIPGIRPLNTAFDDEFEIPTFQEVIELVQEVEAETGLEIGIYPETKHPTYFDRAETFQNEDTNGNGVLDDGEDLNQNGELDVVNGGGAINISLNELLVADLLETGFTDPDRIFIQSFELENLIELGEELLPAAGLEDLPLVQLFGDTTDSFVQPFSNFSRPFDITFNAGEGGLSDAELEEIYGDLVNLVDGGLTAETGYSAFTNAEVLDFISGYASGLGPWQNNILLREALDEPVDANGDGVAEVTNQLTGEVFPLIDLAHDAGLLVHVYTLRDEENFLSLLEDGSLPTPEDQYEQFIELGVDGFFTDFPETGDRVRDAITADVVRSPQNPDVQFESLDGEAPLVIGHRGASGERPEHTLEAYERAIAQGADFIEPDLVTTSDGVLIARHEPILDGTTNVAEVFGPERQATKILDGEEITAYFAEDFTLEEIKQLRATERIPDIRPDNAAFDGQFEIPTLEEVIELVQEVEAETGREIGIYPETKHPTFFDEQGLSLEEPLVQTLQDTGFTDPDRVFIQSFEIANLLDLEGQLEAVGLGDIPLVQLFGDTEGSFINGGGGGFSVPFDVVSNIAAGADLEAIYGDLAAFIDVENPTYGNLANPEALEVIGGYASGLGPWQNNILLREALDEPVDANGDGVAEVTNQLTGEVFPLIDLAHDAGLLVHVYTLRDDEPFLSVLADGTLPTPEDQYEQFIDLGVDGFFTDFPETGRIVVDREIVEPNLPQSRGYEGLAFSPDRTTAYPLLEGSVLGDPEGALRIYEFDLETSQFADELVGFYQLDDPAHAIGDFTPINDDEFLVIERDGLQGPDAAFKKIFKVDFSEVDENGFVAKEEIVDLLDIDDPDDLNGDGETSFDFPFVTIEDVLVIDENTILVANDNNFPFSIGRDFNGVEIDNNEVILLELDEPLNLDPAVIPFALDSDDGATDDGDAADGASGVLAGGEDDDVLGGTPESDRAFGGAGSDIFFGGEGNDIAFGGAGDDVLFGDEDDDTLFGNEGNDILGGGPGNDRNFGGEGSDIFIVALEEGSDRIFDFEQGSDLIGLAGSLSFADLSFASSSILVDGEELVSFGGTLDAATLTEADFIRV